MKVMLVNSLYFPQEVGGAEGAVRVLAEALTQRGIATVVVCLTQRPWGERDVINGVSVVRLPLANLYWPFVPATPKRAWQRLAWHGLDDWNPLMGRRLRQVIAQERPDVVDLNNLAGFSAAAIGAARQVGVPVNQTLHDFYFVCPRTSMFRDGANCAAPCRGCRVLTGSRRRSSERVDLVTGVSAALLAEVRTRGAFTRVPQEVIWNANAPWDRPGSPPLQRAPGTPLRLGFLGRLDVTKGIETLIDAMRLLAHLPLTAAIAGDGPVVYEAALRGRARGLPVTFLGRVAPDALFRQIDFLVVPSVWREPFGRVVQEAFGRSIPVIGARTGGIPEVMGEAGAGLLFRPDDPAALAAIITQLFEHGLDREGWLRHCRQRSAAFDTARIVDRKLASLKRLLAGATNDPQATAPTVASVG